MALLALAACSSPPAEPPVAPAEAPKAAPAQKAEQVEKSADKPAYAEGVVNVLPGGFKRFDGQDLGRALWPQLHRFTGHLDQHNPKAGVLIGMAVNVLSGMGDDPAGEMDVVLLSGPTQDTPKRSLRVATFTSVIAPPGPLVLEASSADNGLRVSSEARFRLYRDGAVMVVEVHEAESRWSRRFRRIGKEWAMEPPRP